MSRVERGRTLELNEKHGRDSRVSMLLEYTFLFAIFVIGIYFVLLISRRSFIQYGDPYRQGYFRVVEMRNQINNILSGKGFQMWSWYEGTGFDETFENFLDPFVWVAAMFPKRYTELGYTFAALLRMYMGGIGFLILGREVSLQRVQRLVGSVCYVFSGWFVSASLCQSEFLGNMVRFPLLIFGVERIYKRKSPLPFILIIAYYMIRGIYFAYMAALVVILYIMLRYFAYRTGTFAVKEYLINLLKFIGYGVSGILLSAIASLVSASTLLSASSGNSRSAIGMLFDTTYYKELGGIIMGTGMTYDYMDVGLPILVIILLPIAIRRCNLKSTNTIMTLILFAMMFVPFFCSMFNGGGYTTLRWTFMLILFAIWTGVEQLDISIIRERGNIALMIVGLVVIGAWTFGLFLMGKRSFDITATLYVPIQLTAGAVMIMILAIAARRSKRDGSATEDQSEMAGVSHRGVNRKTAVALVAIMFISLSAGWSYGFYNNRESFNRNASIYKRLEQSVWRAGPEIDDDGFYRVDSVDGILRHARLTFPSNENVYWRTNCLYEYNSRLPEELVEFNVMMGNTYGYARRVYMLSNGNRMGLDLLYGVKYFLGTDRNNEETADSDNYAGYGFNKIGEIDGVSLFENKYNTGLGFVCGKVMARSEFEKLPRLAMEQALLQAAVVPDDDVEKYPDSMIVRSGDIEADIVDVPVEVVETDGVDVSGFTSEGGRFIAECDDATFTIETGAVEGREVFLSFDELMRDADDGGDQSASFVLTCEADDIYKMIVNQRSRQGVAGLKNHELDMGYRDGKCRFTIRLSNAGTYTFDGMHVNAVSTDLYDKYAAKCEDNRLEVTEYDDSHVAGTINADTDGILFLSIPMHDNWEIYIDGEKAEKIDGLDIAFTGANVTAGRHDVELKYRNKYLRFGAILSVIGLVLTIVMTLLHRKARKAEIQASQASEESSESPEASSMMP